MITIQDLTTPDENIANWVEDYPPAKPQAAPDAPAHGEPCTFYDAVDPYEFMKTAFEAINPFEDACDALNDALRGWRAIYCPPQPPGS